MARCGGHAAVNGILFLAAFFFRPAIYGPSLPGGAAESVFLMLIHEEDFFARGQLSPKNSEAGSVACRFSRATGLEELQVVPGMHRQVETLDGIGRAISAELIALSSLGSKSGKHVLDSYPALRGQWGEVLEE